MRYFMIRGTEDGGQITELTKEQVVRLAQRLEEGNYEDYGPLEFMSKLDDGDPNYWGEGALLIKGEIVVPRPKVTETVVVKEWEV